MIKALIIIIIILGVNLIALWGTLGIKWLIICRDWHSKKDYLREINDNLSKYCDRLDKTINLHVKIIEAIQNESKFRE